MTDFNNIILVNWISDTSKERLFKYELQSLPQPWEPPEGFLNKYESLPLGDILSGVDLKVPYILAYFCVSLHTERLYAVFSFGLEKVLRVSLYPANTVMVGAAPFHFQNGPHIRMYGKGIHCYL